MRKGIYSQWIVACIACIFFLSIPIRAVAIDADAVGANPTPTANGGIRSWFVYTLDPGSTQDDVIVIKNISSKTRDMLLYPVDATATKDGSFAPLLHDDPHADVSSWIKIDSDERITMQPNGVKKIPFHITVPQNATPGMHAGALILQGAPPSSESGVTGVNIVTRVGIRMYLTVTGEQREVLLFNSLTAQQGDKDATILLSLKNGGNTNIFPNVTVDIIRESDSSTLKTFSQDSFVDLLPGLEAAKSIVWQNSRGNGLVRIHATATTGTTTLSLSTTLDTGMPVTPTTTPVLSSSSDNSGWGFKNITFPAVIIILLACIILLLVMLIAVLFFKKKKKRAKKRTIVS